MEGGGQMGGPPGTSVGGGYSEGGADGGTTR